MNNKITNLYKMLYPSLELSNKNSLAKDFIEMAKQSGIDSFEDSAFEKYKENPYFVEKNIISYVFFITGIQLDIDYISLYAKQMSAAGLTDNENSAVFFDELLSYSLLSFILTICSMANDKSSDNFQRCIKNSIVLLDLQGRKQTIGVHNTLDILKMLILPTNVMHLAMDIYWTIWTFIIGHELYHLTNKKETSNYQEELDADRYGYHVLMQMITAQKEKKVPFEIQVFYENMYLTPVILMEYFKLQDFYCKLCGNPTIYEDRPEPSIRREQLFKLFDSEVPDCLNTEDGNTLLNIFLDTIDIIQEQIIIKKTAGKLNF